MNLSETSTFSQKNYQKKNQQPLQLGGNQQSTLFPIEFFMCHVEQAQSPFFTKVIKILQIDCHSQQSTVLLSAGAKLALRLLSALFIPVAHLSLEANATNRQVTVPIVL